MIDVIEESFDINVKHPVVAAIALATSRMRVSSGLADIRHRQLAIVHLGPVC